MKKLTLLLAMLLAFGLTVGFADEDQLIFELDGSASTTFGINLDDFSAAGNTGSGLQNDTSFEIDFTIVSEQSAEKGEGDGGWIQFEDFEVTLDETGVITVTAPDVNAELRFGGLYIDIDGSEDISVDQASIFHVLGSAMVIDIDDPDAYEDPTAAVGGDPGFWNYIADLDSPAAMEDFSDLDSAFTTSGVLVIGYKMNDMLDAYVKIGSFNDWRWRDSGEVADDVADREHAYAFGAGAEITFAGFTVNADGILGLNYEDDKPMAFGVGVEYEMMLNDTFTVVPFAGADMLTKQGPADDDLAMEIGGGVKLLWPGFDDEDSNEFSGTYDDDDIVSGFSLSTNFLNVGDADPTMNVVAALYEDAGDESLVPGLGAQAFIEFYDVLGNYDYSTVLYPANDSEFGAGVYAEYAVGDLKPYGKVTFDGWDDDVTLTLGVEASMIANTTFTLQYYNPRVTEHAVHADKYKGVVTFETEISW